MRKIAHILKLGLHTCLSLLSVLAWAADTDLESKLQQKGPSYEVSADSFIVALVKISNQFQIPVGIQWINDEKTRMPVRRSFQGSTVQTIFDSVVAAQPGYEAAIKNGVLHVFPKVIPSEENFLFLKINSFESHDAVVEVGERKLRNIVRTEMSPPNSKPVGVAGSLATNVGEHRVSIRLNDVTVGDVLDALATSSDKKIWIVTFVEDPTLTPAGFHRTISLWNGSPVPDEEQPVWNMFRWDEQVPLAGLQVQ